MDKDVDNQVKSKLEKNQSAYSWKYERNPSLAYEQIKNIQRTMSMLLPNLENVQTIFEFFLI
jgi:hypothetical protein